ncbi:MAG: hypothetical protein ABIK73_05005 [candidate division WOR-3 bacterium]
MRVNLIAVVLFSLIRLSFSDTLPALPLRDLANLEFPWYTPKPPITYKDSFRFSANLSPNLVYRKLGLKLAKKISKSGLFLLQICDEKNVDFYDYHQTKFSWGLGKETKNTWQEFDLTGQRNWRRTNVQYKKLHGQYNLYWFFGDNLLQFNNQLNVLYHKNPNCDYFLLATSQLTGYLPTNLGNIIVSCEPYFRNYNFDKTNNYLAANFSISDLLFWGGHFYLNPGLSYYLPVYGTSRLNPANKYLGLGLKTGFKLKGLSCVTEIQYNTHLNPHYDSILGALNPYQLASSQLSPIIKKIDLSTQITYKYVLLSARYETYQSYWIYNYDYYQNSIILAVYDTVYRSFSLGAEIDFLRYFNNKISLSLSPTELYLFPSFRITDTLIFNYKPLRFLTYWQFSSERLWSNLTLPKYFLVSIQLSVSYKRLTLTGELDNILDRKIFLYPHIQTPKGRKYWLGINFLI